MPTTIANISISESHKSNHLFIFNRTLGTSSDDGELKIKET